MVKSSPQKASKKPKSTPTPSKGPKSAPTRRLASRSLAFFAVWTTFLFSTITILRYLSTCSAWESGAIPAQDPDSVSDPQKNNNTRTHEGDLQEPIHRNGKRLKSCQCVHCQEDSLCGGLWMGEPPPPKPIPIYVVVAHCKSDIAHLGDFIARHQDDTQFDIQSIHILSKCGVPVQLAHPKVTFGTLPNVGREGHNYAHYIRTVLRNQTTTILRRKDDTNEDAVVLFLKDNMDPRNMRQPGTWKPLEATIRGAASSNIGFACGMVPWQHPAARSAYAGFAVSAYADFGTLRQFRIGEYTSAANYKGDGVPFESQYPNLGSYYDSLDVQEGPMEPIVPVCYGGVFAASLRSIQRRDPNLWNRIEMSLARGDNIQEGHYMERLWGAILSSPLEPYQIEAIQNHSDHVFALPLNPLVGLMARRHSQRHSRR